jgi:peptidoglycan/LPS O-acetylase OafA/YrhL
VFRGVAALIVVLYHYLYGVNLVYGRVVIPSLPRALYWLLDGHLAVAFFIISGFVIFLTLARCEAVVDFAIARFIRLYPAFFASVTLTFLTYQVFTPSPPKSAVNAGAYLANLAMIHPWLGLPGVDDVYWSLISEISFYSFVALFLTLGWLKHIERIAIVWATISVANHAFEMCTGFRLPEHLKLTLLLDQSPLFLSGVVFYKIWSGGAERTTRPLLICLMASALFIHASSWPRFLVILAEYVVFSLFIKGKMRWIICRPLVFMGSISYALYLVHCCAGWCVMLSLIDDLGWPVFPSVLMTTLIALATATLITYAIERPAQPCLRKLGDRRRIARAGAVAGSATDGGPGPISYQVRSVPAVAPNVPCNGIKLTIDVDTTSLIGRARMRAQQVISSLLRCRRSLSNPG